MKFEDLTPDRLLVRSDSTRRHGDGTAILQWVVFVGAGLVAAAVFRLVPWRDPVEVVGLPLVTGYAERAEQMGFYAFFVAAVVGAILLRPLMARLTHSAWSVLGAFSTLSLLILVAWCRDVNLPPLVLFGGCGSYFGGAVGVLMTRLPIGSWLLWCGGSIAWLFGSPELRGLLASNPRLLAAVAGLYASVVVVAVSRRGACQIKWLRRGFLAVTLLVIASGSWLAPFDEFQLCLCGAVCWTLGARTLGASFACNQVRRPDCQSVRPQSNIHRRIDNPAYKILSWCKDFTCLLSRDGIYVLTKATQAVAWLEFVGFMTLLVTVLFWLPGRWQDAVPRMLAGAGAAMSCFALVFFAKPSVRDSGERGGVSPPVHSPQDRGADAPRSPVSFLAARVADFRVDPLRLALIAGTLPLVLVRPWFGVLLAGTVAWLWNPQASHRPRARHLWLVFVMSLAFLPTSLRAGIVLDQYHDGYALSCLWEFENGRALYSEMFPLRSFEFYAGLLGRTVLPATVEGYLYSLGLLKFLPVAGVTLLSLVWTRSPHWSFSAGLLCATLGRLDPRQGMQVVLVAAQMGILMSGSVSVSPRRRLALTALPCGIAACVGFDAFVTLVAATCITVFLVPHGVRRPSRVRTLTRSASEGGCSKTLQTCRQLERSPSLALRVKMFRERFGLSLPLAELPRRLRTTASYLAAAVLPFTLVMSLWQGTESASSFWRLLFDYSRHFNAAFGIPVSWTSPEQRFVIASNLLLLSIFAATTVFRWKFLSPRRQRAWCFLTVAYFLALHRGLGRSDALHLGDSVYLTFALGVVGVFEVIRAANRQGLAPAWWKWRNVALLVGVLAAWSTKHASRGPFDLVRYCSSLSSEETFPLPRDEFIAQTVGPKETLWAVERSLAHVANQRHGPTRHALAHCIGSPSEQRRAVNDMRRNPPRLILWPASVEAREQWSVQLPAGWEGQQRFVPGLPTADVMIGVDNVPSPLRYFIISQHVLRHYRPAEQPGYLVPAEPDFPGFTVIPSDLNGPLRCGRLPLSWGETRLPFLGHRIAPQTFEIFAWRQDFVGRIDNPAHVVTAGEARAKHFAALPTWISTVSPESDVTLPEASSGWRFSGSIDPREINYLAITVTARVTDVRRSSVAVLTIRFASPDARDSPSEATFVLEADAEPHSYLVPIGCSPGWTWRSMIGTLELMASSGCVMKSPQVTALRINDLDDRDER